MPRPPARAWSRRVNKERKGSRRGVQEKIERGKLAMAGTVGRKGTSVEYGHRGSRGKTRRNNRSQAGTFQEKAKRGANPLRPWQRAEIPKRMKKEKKGRKGETERLPGGKLAKGGHGGGKEEKNDLAPTKNARERGTKEGVEGGEMPKSRAPCRTKG